MIVPFLTILILDDSPLVDFVTGLIFPTKIILKGVAAIDHSMSNTKGVFFFSVNVEPFGLPKLSYIAV